MPLPRVVADTPLNPVIEALLAGKVEILPWSVALEGTSEPVAGLYTYGHLLVDGPMLDRLPGLKVVSNYGVGVDHIRLVDAAARNIPVGNTPGILNGATADMGFTLLLAAARRLIEGDRYARCADFTRYDPGYMLGQEVHGRTLGIVGMGRIGQQVARRARAFDMPVLYYNRRQNAAVEQELQARYVGFDELLRTSDYVMLCCPLSDETRGLIDAAALAKMKPTAILVNIARGPVVDTQALTVALQTNQIYAAGLDVTDPEPLSRDHPLLKLDNVTIAPHLGSATEQTRRRMAEISVENLLRGIAGEPLLHQVYASP
ncbi:Glyoxylate/hydroxypyruvate reductase B [Anatilimnocola aggregata]|uniref:Glyoxylate/hydroxypyruvate reductase B n=1 Tax=Anatilimnocola aggregata TaxID=2528021 RepID=A0A517YIW1_9BACT|nr:D-glycerate dehydrogenase [Anatilimnocola aggregata]QDU30159.1 Glyoxylate/hydroxypyruvate reductase B [Anatilimnocola aggregata]